MATTKSTSIHIRIQRTLLRDLTKLAVQDKRTVSDWARLLIEDAVQRRLNGKEAR